MAFTLLTAPDLADAASINSRLAQVEAPILAGVSIPTGTILWFAGPGAPLGWLSCDGTAISRVSYAALFAIIGTSFGAGDGSTTFNLPDFRGRAAIGAGQGASLTNRMLAQTLGEENHQLTTAELPAHTHTATNAAGSLSMATGASGTSFNSGSTQNTASAGSDTAHNNMQPSLVMIVAIKI